MDGHQSASCLDIKRFEGVVRRREEERKRRGTKTQGPFKDVACGGDADLLILCVSIEY